MPHDTPSPVYGFWTGLTIGTVLGAIVALLVFTTFLVGR
jgi:hypothetical protein